MAAGARIPGLGHPVHRVEDPRTARMYRIADETGLLGPNLQALRAVAAAHRERTGRALPINGAGVAGAALADLGFPAEIVRGFALLARTAGLVAHLAEEMERPLGMPLFREVEDRAATRPATAVGDDQVGGEAEGSRARVPPRTSCGRQPAGPRRPQLADHVEDRAGGERVEADLERRRRSPGSRPACRGTSGRRRSVRPRTATASWAGRRSAGRRCRSPRSRCAARSRRSASSPGRSRRRGRRRRSRGPPRSCAGRSRWRSACRARAMPAVPRRQLGRLRAGRHGRRGAAAGHRRARPPAHQRLLDPGRAPARRPRGPTTVIEPRGERRPAAPALGDVEAPAEESWAASITSQKMKSRMPAESTDRNARGAQAEACDRPTGRPRKW